MIDRWESKNRRASLQRASLRRHATTAEEDAALKKLEEKFPEATNEERIRFLRSCKCDLEFANKELQDYLDWRKTYDLDSVEHISMRGDSDDKGDWAYASSRALQTMSRDPHDTRKSITKRRVSSPRSLPCVIRTYYDENGNPRTAKDGTMILQVLPALLDKTVASNECYALAMAFYTERKFERSSLAAGTLLIDVRRGVGWPNPTAKHLVPFIKEVARMLPKLHPERLNKCLVYPVPRMAKIIWKTIKPMLSECVTGLVTLVTGPARIESPPPKELYDHVDKAVVERLEAERSVV